MPGKVISLALVTGLTGTLSLSAAVSAAGSTAHNAVGAGATSVRGPAIARGRVAGASGQGLAGLRVSVYAWPDSKVLSALRPGQRVPWRLVGSAVTGRSGDYTVRVSSPVALLSSAERNGVVNLEVTAGDASYGFSRNIARSTPNRLVLKSATSDNTDRVVPAERVNLRVGKGNRAAGEDPAAAAALHCTGWVFVSTLGPHWDIVGQTYVATHNVQQGFTYHNGQSSTLGIGFSASGKKGSFSANGTASESSSTSETFPVRWHDYVYYQTEFTYGKYHRKCTNEPEQWEARPTGYAGGAKSVLISNPPRSPHCVSQENGSTFEKDTTRAVTWTNGISVPVLGFSASSETGYDKSASITFHFHASHHLCGTGGFPGGTPSQLVARD